MREAGSLSIAAPRRVLMIRRRALGDALVTLPAVLSLHEALPDAELDLVVDRSLAKLFGSRAGVNVLAWDERDRLGALAWIGMLRRRHYDLVIDFLSTPQTALWTALSGARWRVGYDLRWRSWAYNVRVPRNRSRDLSLRQFAGESFLDPLRALGLSLLPWLPRGRFDFADSQLGGPYLRWRARLEARARPRLGLVLSATWPAKSWPLAAAARLARIILREGTTVVLLPGPGEESVLAPLLAEVPEIICPPPTDLCELADLVGRLDVLVATDSGPRHLAAVMGVPTVTLFGPTDPGGWNPEHPLHVAVRTGEDCSPCDLPLCPLPDHPCMTRLSAEMVAEAVRQVLSGVRTVDAADS
ncbi:glycosyltransferase family 9 protein [bacterium]|nr:glycosyltransferase family 9 protein [bacterium]MBU1074012.1 glycosyltransferase family 9 protein [bacterium]MBU1675558.1 glycosyltransferase family 9 protein [bacterium]